MKKDLSNFCKCGCGGKTPVAKYSCAMRGWKLNQPISYIHGHNMRGKKRIGAMTGKKHSVEAKIKMSLSSRKGPESNMWRGGVYNKNELQRRSSAYRIWRDAVYKRDNWTCVMCKQRGGELNADHIKPFSLYPNLRFEVSNGRTLCKNCHKKTTTYGYNARYYQLQSQIEL